MSDVIVQLIVNGLIAGSMYALIASGFSLIYTTNRFIHFAHGVVAVAGGYTAYQLFTVWNLPFAIAVIGAITLSSALGGVMYRLIYKPLKGKGSSSTILLMASLGLMILVQNSIQLYFGTGARQIGLFEIQEGIEIFGARVTPLQLVIMGLSVVLLISLWWFVYKSKLGMIIRAVADNPELAATTGLNAARIELISFCVASGLAGVAGVLIGLEQNLEPIMGTSLIVKGFSGAIIGGVTSIPGAVLGSYLLGLVENFGVWYFPSGYKDAIAFMLLFVFLVVRPNGLLGIDKGVRQ